jgi:DNA polymerase-3 subunit epsilon
MRALYLDIATTGIDLSNDRVVEIGITEVIDGELSGNVFHHYLYPGNLTIDSGVVEVNGYNLEFLQDKPSFSDIAAELSVFMYDAEIIALVTAFDVGFLNIEFKRANQPQLNSLCRKITDLRDLARKTAPNTRTDLKTLLKTYGIKDDRYLSSSTKLQSSILLYSLHTTMLNAYSMFR